jgi:hypothetical protein
LRVGRARIVEHPVGQAGLDHLAVLHHHHAVRQQPRDREVVRDDDDGQAEIVDEAAQQVEQARLHRDIETAGRLVHEDEPRPGDEIARDLQPLAHAAGKGARLIVYAVNTDFDPAEPVGRGFADIAVMALADGHQPLADIGARGYAHPQPVGGILVHEAPVGAHQKRRSASPMR